MMSAPALISGWALISGSAAFDFGVGTLRPPGPCPQSASAHRRHLHQRNVFHTEPRHCTPAANQLFETFQRLGQHRPLEQTPWPGESHGGSFLPGLGGAGKSRILLELTMDFGISASGRLAGSVPGAHLRNTILKPVVTEPSICTVFGAWPKPRSASHLKASVISAMEG